MNLFYLTTGTLDLTIKRKELFNLTMKKELKIDGKFIN